MINLENFIESLFKKWSCLHKWERYHRINVVRDGCSLPSETRDTLICTECGKIKKIIL